MSKSSTPKKKVKLLSGLEWKPRPYMNKAMKFILQNPACGLFLDPGLGKTSITLGAFRILKESQMVRRMLVVAPVRVAYNVWPSEARKWNQFAGYKVVVLHGKDKTDENINDPTVDIFVINPEGLEWLLTKDRFKRLGAEMFVLDESSKFKNTQTKRFKLLRPYLPRFLRRVILTGSPAPKNYLDLFGQVYIMDLGRALGAYITHYRNKFFHPTGFGGYTWVLNDGAAAEIQEAIRPYVMRLEAEDHIEMPKLVETDVWVDLPASVRRIYDDMEDDLVSQLEDGEVLESPTAAAARGKCAQIASGFSYKNPVTIDEPHKKGEYVELHDAKLDALGEILAERQGQPTLVFYWFQAELELIRARFGKDLPSISEVSVKEGKILEDAWNRNEIPVLLGNPASVGHGLNMQEGNAQHAVWFTLPDDYDVYDQANRRIRRSGNKASHVFAHRILAKRTVDQVKARMLSSKGANQKSFLDAMKEYRK